jgi:hypothetical protein
MIENNKVMSVSKAKNIAPAPSRHTYGRKGFRKMSLGFSKKSHWILRTAALDATPIRRTSNRPHSGMCPPA